MKNDTSLKEFNAIDLFAGGGGLSWGLMKAGFRILAAVEINKEISKTYIANHPDTHVFVEDIRNINKKRLKDIFGNKKIHLVAGCPPCQGFSKLNREDKLDLSRDFLPLEMARIILELKPEIVMMENVPGIVSKGREILNNFIQIIESEGYIVNWKVLQVADYGVPQSRKRFVLLAGRGFEIQIPDSKDKKRKTLRETLKNIKESPLTLKEANKKGGPTKFNWHIIRDLQEINIRRLRATEEGSNRSDLPEELRPNCHKKKNKGFGNFYGRMSWDKISPTITRGCTTLSMGRFGHPSEDRTISVREAAMIQTFPKNYKFNTASIGWASVTIGNAFPPKLAKLLGKECISYLN